MIFYVLVLFFFCLNQVNSHQLVISPINRNRDTGLYADAHGCFVAWHNWYLSGYKCKGVCGTGEFSFDLSDVADNIYEKTGPITATYKMGQTIDIKFYAKAHRGPFRMKLCKLAKSTDIVNQACLDQHLLELKDFNPKIAAFYLKDKYTLFKKDWSNTPNVTIQVKLPDGLICDNCVLQWEWIMETDSGCVYENGSNAPSEFCLNQQYRTCIDIKIEKDASQANQVYKPISFSSVYPSNVKTHPPVFRYINWQWMRKDKDDRIIKPSKPDELAYKGTGLMCFSGNSNGTADSNYAKKCRENCMSSIKQCPSECACRWFSYL